MTAYLLELRVWSVGLFNFIDYIGLTGYRKMTMKCRAQVLELMKDAGLEARPEQYKALLDACKGASGTEKGNDDYYLGLKIREMMGGGNGADSGNVQVDVDAKEPAFALLDA